jgi:hypothetical protein
MTYRLTPEEQRMKEQYWASKSENTMNSASASCTHIEASSSKSTAPSSPPTRIEADHVQGKWVWIYDDVPDRPDDPEDKEQLLEMSRIVSSGTVTDLESLNQRNADEPDDSDYESEGYLKMSEVMRYCGDTDSDVETEPGDSAASCVVSSMTQTSSPSGHSEEEGATGSDGNGASALAMQCPAADQEEEQVPEEVLNMGPTLRSYQVISLRIKNHA